MEVICIKPIDTFKNRLTYALKIRNMKPVELHEKTGISESLLSKYLSGTTYARQKKISIIADVLDVSPVWLMGYDISIDGTITVDEIGNPVTPIPILGSVKAGFDYLAQENWIGTINIEKNLVGSGKDYFALNVKGDSMNPLFIEGDTIIIHKQNDCDNNQIAVCIINGNEATVKKVIKTNDGIELHSVNPYYPTKKFTKKEMNQIPVIIVGVVKKLERKF